MNYMLQMLSRIVSKRNTASATLPIKCAALPFIGAPISRWGALLLTVSVLGAIGCGGNSATTAGPISVTDPNGIIAGQLTSLDIAGTAKVSMTPVNDPSQAGVDWTVFCGGNPITGSVSNGACGSFSPSHTSSGSAAIYTGPSIIPAGTTVTIIATVTGDPAASSSVMLPIVALPISVSAITGSTSMMTGTSAFFTATALNDTSGAGLSWTVTCGSSNCGSFSPMVTTPNSSLATKYTAPPSVPTGGSVTITATSVTVPGKSSSLTVSITPPPPPPVGAVAISLSPANAYVTTTGGTRNLTLTAIVTGDTANAGLTWSCFIGGTKPCGSAFNANPAVNDVATATFQASAAAAPVGSVATITATSVTGAVPSSPAMVTVVSTAPIVITMTKLPPSSLGEGATAQLVATAAPTGQDITWSCGSANCGSFSPNPTTSGMTTTYTAPSAIPPGGVAVITAASVATTPANPAVATTTITTPAPAITFTQEPPASVPATAQVLVSATVTNDSTPPGGVTWSLMCSSTVPGGCGSVTHQTMNGATATYTAPPVVPSGTVTVVATSTSFTGVTKGSTPITITQAPSSISFAPSLPAQLPGYAVVNLNAAVSNDTTNEGVDWNVCPSGCGFFTTVAAIPAIPATPTTPYVPAVPAVTATSVSAWPNGLPISYTAPLFTSPGESVTVTATAHVKQSVAASSLVMITNDATGPTLKGVVQAGVQPVVGAAVALYAAGTTGYGSLATVLYAPQGSAYASTDDNGSFSIPSGYTCPTSTSQVYLVATGGKVSGISNSNLAMMTALGSCATLSSSPVVVNEVTTVGSAWALAPFGANNALSGESSYLYLGTSSSNLAGLANAFASVNNLVNISTGQAQFTALSGNAAVPYAEINTLADILNSCTASSGGSFNDGSPCGTLFANVPNLGIGGKYNGTVPADTLQAAFNIAQRPASSFGYGTAYGLVTLLLPLATANSPFQPILTAAPNDWSISLNFSANGGLSGSSKANFFAIDATGNLWITDTKENHVIEWNTTGAAVSPSSGFSAGGIVSPGALAIDPAGNVWISGANGLTELDDVGTPALGSPFTGGTGGLGMAIDGSSNIWITDSNAVQKFNDVGTQLSPSGGYINSGVTGIEPIAIDDSNNVWVGYGGFNLALLSDASGQLVANAPSLDGDTDSTQSQIVVDASGNVWFVSSVSGGATGSVCKLPAYGGLGSMNWLATCYAGGPLGGGLSPIGTIAIPHGIALDGAGNLWIGNAGGSGIPPNLTEINPSLLNNPPVGYAGFASSNLSTGPVMVALDGSGNAWVLLADNTITEYVGVATPVITPTALAVKNQKIGKTP